MYGNETVDTFTEVFAAASVADKTALQVGNGFVIRLHKIKLASKFEKYIIYKL